MQYRGSTSTLRLTLTAVLAAVLSTGVAVAQADPGDDAPQGPPIAMGPGARMVRGTVTAIAGDRISLKTDAGDVFQVALTPNTRLMRDRAQARAADIKVGDSIGAMGEIDQSNKTVHALFVSVVDAEQVQKIKESLGKTWISGKVTAIDDLKLTILRSDKVSQTIAVDEDTSFKRGGRGMAMAMQGDGSMAMGGGGWRRGRDGSAAAPGAPGGRPPAGDAGESITLADIKVGDVVAGQGTLKNGVFVPATLAVSDPSQQHRRRQHGEGDGAPAGGGAPAGAPPQPNATAANPPAGPK